MSENQQPVQNAISVSNSDIVTMMIHKNREHIKNKKLELLNRRNVILDDMKDKLDKEFIKHINKYGDYEEIDSLLKILNKKNPKILISYEKTPVDNFPEYSIRRNIPEETEVKHKNFYVPIILNGIKYLEDDDDNEEYWGLSESLKFPYWFDACCFTDDGNRLLIDLKKPFVYKFKCSKELIEISAELDKCNEYLDNEAKMKEVLISKMTEKTLMNMPQLQYITKDILLLG